MVSTSWDRLAAVIGDVIRSRQAGPDLFDRLEVSLARTNDRLVSVQPLQITIGDEFQGIYDGLGQALNATLYLRLVLLDVAGVRFGVGWGDIVRRHPDRAPYEQDGSGWWAAREALDLATRREKEVKTPAGWSTAVCLPSRADRSGDAAEHDGAASGNRARQRPSRFDLAANPTVEALVMMRDHVVGGLDRRDAQLVLALLDGMTVTEAAALEGITQQAASRRLHTNGGYALVRSWQMLEGHR